jgi:hypothetical protein
MICLISSETRYPGSTPDAPKRLTTASVAQTVEVAEATCVRYFFSNLFCVEVSKAHGLGDGMMAVTVVEVLGGRGMSRSFVQSHPW